MKRSMTTKDTELRLISELMKNGRRSDRELAKAVGMSQPTVTRVRTKLEKEGIIKEYAMIPDFRKLGFELASITFVKLRKELSEKESDEFRRYCKQLEKKSDKEAILMAMNGLGMGYDRVFISFHKDYSSYVKVIGEIKKIQDFDSSRIDSFMIDLNDGQHFQPLTFSAIANYLLKAKENQF
jgi:DNA-binding Lrp family transcriptional regulator